MWVWEPTEHKDEPKPCSEAQLLEWYKEESMPRTDGFNWPLVGGLSLLLASCLGALWAFKWLILWAANEAGKLFH